MKSSLVDCWINQLAIQELREQEVEVQRQNLQMHPDRFRDFTAMTYEGDDGDCLEITAMLLIALLRVEFVGFSDRGDAQDAAVSNRLAFAFAYPSLVSLQCIKSFFATELPALLSDAQRASVWR